MNTTETNLIFEAYTRIFNENNNDVSVIEQLTIFIENHPEFSVQLSPIWNEMSEITKELGKFDIEEDDIEELEIYINDLNGVFNKLESFVHNNPQTEQELSPILYKFEDAIEEFDGYYSGGHLNQDELYGIVGRFTSANEEDGENYNRGENEEGDSEGAVNLLEQLKAEVPELEDKINQVLEKIFVAVDILKQEPYTDDPQLVKAYASLIEGDF